MNFLINAFIDGLNFCSWLIRRSPLELSFWRNTEQRAKMIEASSSTHQISAICDVWICPRWLTRLWTNRVPFCRALSPPPKPFSASRSREFSTVLIVVSIVAKFKSATKSACSHLKACKMDDVTISPVLASTWSLISSVVAQNIVDIAPRSW